MTIKTLFEIAKEFGPWLVFMGFFVWTGYCREKTLSARISKIEDEYNSTLKELINKCVDTINENINTMKTFRSEVEGLRKDICILDNKLEGSR